MRLSDISCGSASPRFSRQSRNNAGSSSPRIMRASEPPTNKRRSFSPAIITCLSKTLQLDYNRQNIDRQIFSTELMESFDPAKAGLVITREQCRGARGLLGWSQADLAEAALIGVVTVR